MRRQAREPDGEGFQAVADSGPSLDRKWFSKGVNSLGIQEYEVTPVYDEWRMVIEKWFTMLMWHCEFVL